MPGLNVGLWAEWSELSVRKQAFLHFTLSMTEKKAYSAILTNCVVPNDLRFRILTSMIAMILTIWPYGAGKVAYDSQPPEMGRKAFDSLNCR